MNWKSTGKKSSNIHIFHNMINARINAYELICCLSTVKHFIKYRLVSMMRCFVVGCALLYISYWECVRECVCACFFNFSHIFYLCCLMASIVWQMNCCVSDVKHKIQLFINRSATNSLLLLLFVSMFVIEILMDIITVFRNSQEYF